MKVQAPMGGRVETRQKKDHIHNQKPLEQSEPVNGRKAGIHFWGKPSLTGLPSPLSAVAFGKLS
jgi:hypothetical protein